MFCGGVRAGAQQRGMQSEVDREQGGREGRRASTNQGLRMASGSAALSKVCCSVCDAVASPSSHRGLVDRASVSLSGECEFRVGGWEEATLLASTLSDGSQRIRCPGCGNGSSVAAPTICSPPSRPSKSKLKLHQTSAQSSATAPIFVK